MCWKCQELDVVIEHYRELSARTADSGSLKGIHVLIERLEGSKKTLHRDDPDCAET
jgi:hypothetical protein